MIIAATGHRPNKLGNAYELTHPTNIAIGREMRAFLLQKSEETDEVIHTISGMALGVDTIWAKVVLKLRKEFPKRFELECAIPCANQQKRWKEADQVRFLEILKEADDVIYVSTAPYEPYLMQKRNEYMVNKADLLFAVWDGTKGGTGNCVAYATKKNKPIHRIQPNQLSVVTLS
jgi:uncharacterized phage-like protein YoqJ